MDRASPLAAEPPVNSAVLPLVLETALDGVVVIGVDGVVADWNDPAEAMFGWSREEAVGRVLAELVIPPALREAHRAGLNRYLITREGPLLKRRIEVTAIRRSGEEFPIELSISPLVMDGATLFLGFVRDITDRRRAEALLKRQAREAEILNQVTTRAAEAVSFDEILRLCLASVCELTGWPAGHAFLPVGTHPVRLESAKIWHGDLGRFAGLMAATESIAFGPGEGLPGRIWAAREPCWIADVTDSDAFPRAALAADIGVRSAFGFPIMGAGEVSAVLEFFSHDPAQMDPRLLHIVRTLGEQVGRVLERQAEQRHQALLLEELDHRAKNMLAVVMGMADQTARRADSLDAFRQTFSSRLTSLARGYSLMTAGQWRTASLETVIRQIVQPFSGKDEARIALRGETVMTPPKAALALTMVVHELITNASKYGALSTPEGKILIQWSKSPVDPHRIELEWVETGLSGVAPPRRRGFGSKLIEATIQRDLGGEVAVEFAPQGIRYRFAFPEPQTGPHTGPHTGAVRR